MACLSSLAVGDGSTVLALELFAHFLSDVNEFGFPICLGRPCLTGPCFGGGSVFLSKLG
jgi:hypothetical protein